MASRTGRLLRLLDLLDGGRPWRSCDLAGLLDIPERTLRRDLAELRDLGYRIDGVPGRGGHYRMIGPGGPSVPPIPRETTAEVIEVEETAIQATGPDADPLFVLLAHAAADHREVLFTHTGAHGAQPRSVEPVRLVFLSDRWYLHGWDRDRRDWRTFRLDRIADASLTGNRFVPARLPREDVAALLRDRFHPPAEEEVVLELDADPVTAASLLHRVDGTLEPLGDGRGTRYTARVDSHEWLLAVLAVSDVGFAVVSPPEFCDRVRQLARRFTRAVGDSC